MPADLRTHFQRGLEKRLRDPHDPAAIMEAAVEALGRQLGAQRVGYGRVKQDDATVTLETCFADGVPPLEGTMRSAASVRRPWRAAAWASASPAPTSRRTPAEVALIEEVGSRNWGAMVGAAYLA